MPGDQAGLNGADAGVPAKSGNSVRHRRRRWPICVTVSLYQQADQLREQGQYAAAYDKLVVALQADPQNRDLMLAMARLYQSGKLNKQAGQVYNYLMTNDTPTQDARVGRSISRFQASDTQRAQQLMGAG